MKKGIKVLTISLMFLIIGSMLLNLKRKEDK